MEPIDLSDLSEHALLPVDSAPIIYVLERRAKFGSRFRPLFEAHERLPHAPALVTHDRDFSRVRALRIIS